ncbi:hypothetical protein BJL95_03265 [Methylomonas sp. LWB]|uniref:DUF2309 domain-containing protein n=1 Tax=Methylomonas sp. LWB TaxID=1905845 RepID=UPI0008DA22EB|nr:DUF2309 domain-containing protein [Methylomonas sp. LWB]OHX34178.1 hypothetical protein BJL95_03265 [Methylomonas sp. LWB]
MSASTAAGREPRQIVLDAIAHLDHVLPGQAPIHDFVHHNTLHGFQHLPFEQALAEFTALTGIDCYLPIERFREFYRQGRISDAELDAELARHFGDDIESVIARSGGRPVTLRALYRLALLEDITPISSAQWSWQVGELGVLAEPEAAAAWRALLAVLELREPQLHAEDLLDLSAEQAEDWLSGEGDLRQRAAGVVDECFARIGHGLSLRGLLAALTGVDVLDQVRPILIGLCASWLDEGLAAWQLPDREGLGLYRAWRRNLDFDPSGFFHDLDDWDDIVAALPDDAADAVVQQLQALAIPEDRWSGYLQRLSLELPGWSGLINWRQTHPGYRNGAARPELADYLALRLILDRAFLQTHCRTLWHCDARYDKLAGYFGKHVYEFFVRDALFGGDLPEYLVQACQAQIADGGRDKSAWQGLAERIRTWQRSPLAAVGGGLAVYDHGWRLWRICRALGLNAAEIGQLSKAQLLHWLSASDGFDDSARRRVWLGAYERHYRDQVLQALHANRRRGRWARREHRPAAQIVFCMDDREEGFRRHLEELNPDVETLGAAGFFGVPMNYRGLDDAAKTPLCPVVVVPAHDVEEQAAPGTAPLRASRHRAGGGVVRGLADFIHHRLRRDPWLAYPAINAMAPLTLAGLVGKTLFPRTQQNLLAVAAKIVAPDLKTRLNFSATEPTPATPEQPRLGFTDLEQAERVAGFLRNTGLTYGFAEWVVLMGHGSMSRNNPHLAAYDCGACSGRHGGPNARLFAAMANRAEVRLLLAERGIVIPPDTYFIGAEHNTCDEDIAWYDLDGLPAERRSDWLNLNEQLRHAQRMSAHERCRRLASAPRQPRPAQALRHFLNRAADFSQARPELGHATNAAAYVGRRAASQGAFFDRRLFLISYDPTQDPSGQILEGILLAVGPVGAGINLEYYFSTVNNERLGCGSKVPHNLTGFFAVMEGAGSDLRTGLPKQMIEIHEAMRLQIIVEAKIGVLTEIYQRQDGLRELIGGGWVHLSAQDPDSGEIFVFERGDGFVPWQPLPDELPIRENSPDCYRDASEPVAPMLIRQAGVER